jgi:integrase/recombinase XerD
MALTKQAKTLTPTQIKTVLAYLETTRHANRNRLILLLSVRQGMRAKEIACLTWSMILNSEGTIGSSINLTNQASKGKASGRSMPMHPEVRAALAAILPANASGPVVTTQKSTSKKPGTSAQVIVNLFAQWYRDLGYQGASSHSGRRTAITGWARKISLVGGSLRDVQALSGHRQTANLERYIEYNTDAQKALVGQT